MPRTRARPRNSQATQLESSPQPVEKRGRVGRNPVLDQKNSPSRFRFRPQSRLTIRLRVLPTGSASTYLRPVLGAIRTVGIAPIRFKGVASSLPALCDFFVRAASGVGDEREP